MWKSFITDRYVCGECRNVALFTSRWHDGPNCPSCPACGSTLMDRRQGFARGLRDAFILTNAA